MKKNHLYFGVFIIAFAANVSAMNPSEKDTNKDPIKRLIELQRIGNQDMLTRAKRMDLLKQFLNINLDSVANIKSELEKLHQQIHNKKQFVIVDDASVENKSKTLKKVKKSLPSLFNNNNRKLNLLHKSITGNTRNGKACVIVIGTNTDSKLKVISHYTSEKKIFESIKIVSPENKASSNWSKEVKEFEKEFDKFVKNYTTK